MIDTINVDGETFSKTTDDDFSSLILLTYSDRERGNITVILNSFVARYHDAVNEILNAIDHDLEFSPLTTIRERVEILLLLERLHTAPKLVLNVFKLSNYEKTVNILEAKRWV